MAVSLAAIPHRTEKRHEREAQVTLSIMFNLRSDNLVVITKSQLWGVIPSRLQRCKIERTVPLFLAVSSKYYDGPSRSKIEIFS